MKRVRDKLREREVSPDPGFDVARLGASIKAAREGRGLAMRAIAERAGYSVTHISQIERGRTCPTIGALARIARAVGYDPQYFLEPARRPELRVSPRGQLRESRLDSRGTAMRILALSDGIAGGRLSASRAILRPHESPEHAGWLCIPELHVGYVLRGRVIVECRGEQHSFGEGDAVVVQPAVPLRFYNPGPDDLDLVCLVRDERAYRVLTRRVFARRELQPSL